MSSSAVDTAVLALLAASERIVLWADETTVIGNHWPLFDGHVADADESDMTIGAPLPYLVFYSTPGRAVRPRAGRTSTMRAVEFQITVVGEDRAQVKLAAGYVDNLLDSRVVTPADDRVRRIRRTDDNLFVSRDDTWTRPGGAPLFMSPARYVATTKR